MFGSLIVLAALGLCCVAPGHAQSRTGGAVKAQNQGQQPRLTFDVAAIHRSSAGTHGGFVKPLPNGTGYVVQNMTVESMMAVLYHVPPRGIEGGPDWFSTERFDLEAKTSGTYGLDDLHTMFKNLLTDRFGLKFHTVIKHGPVYELTVDKSGVKMKAQSTGNSLNIPINPSGPGKFVGIKVSMSYLCWFLGPHVESDPRPVIDKTGLTGLYDFTLIFMPQLPPGVPIDALPAEMQNRPTLQDALQEQLGLQLVPAKGPVEIYVIDKANEPSEN